MTMHRTATKIGQELLRKGLIDHSDLKKALLMQKLGTRGRLGEILVKNGAISEKKLLSTIAALTRVPLIDLSRYTLDPEVTGLIPLEMVENLGVIPLSITGTMLTVAMTDPLDTDVITALEVMTACSINRVLCSHKGFRYALGIIAGRDESTPRISA